MKEVVYTKQALLQFEESVKELVEQIHPGGSMSRPGAI